MIIIKVTHDLNQLSKNNEFQIVMVVWAFSQYVGMYLQN